MNFNWKNYVLNYPDLVKVGIVTEELAIKHYTRFGKKEGRTDKGSLSLNNTSINLGGRFGNILFYNFVADYISRKNNIKFNYNRNDDLKRLGLNFHIGNNTYNETTILTDENIDSFFEDVQDTNIVIMGYFQTPKIAKYIKNHVLEIKDDIKTQNKFDYNNNNLYVHLRLGDIVNDNIHESLYYYDTVISKIKFDKGYISSDSIDHEYCKYLIKILQEYKEN